MSTCFLFYTCLATFVFVHSSDADCNLLKDSGSEISSYIDTESKDSIITMCLDNDRSILSKWENYQCEYIENRVGVKTCWPQRRMSHCSPGNLKGVVFLYHGYSACPNYYNEIGDQLQNECYHVYLPLIIGHGYNYCNSNDSSSCIAGIYNLTNVPISREPYIEYVNIMIDIINDEVSIIKQCELISNPLYKINNIEVAVGGLSFGANIATAIVVLSDTDSVITKQIICTPGFIAPFIPWDHTIITLLNSPFLQGLEQLSQRFAGEMFGINDNYYNHLNTLSNINIDSIHSSYVKFTLFLIEFAVFLFENASIPLLNDLFDDIIINDGDNGTAECEDAIKYYDRGGFCQSTLRHFLAMGSFVQYIMKVVVIGDHNYNDDVETLLILTERDPNTVNSVTIDYVYSFYNDDEELIENKSSNCMWLISEKCKITKQYDLNKYIDDNTCGVGHSFFTKAFNLAVPPYYMYWNETLTNGIIAWLNNYNDEERKQYHYGDNFRVLLDDWDGTRNQCVELDLINPPKKFVYPSNLRKELNEVANINYNKILSKMIDDGFKKKMKYYISDFLDTFEIIKEYNDNMVNVERNIIKYIKKNEDFRYWIWKLLDIKIDSIQSLSQLLDIIYYKLSKKHFNQRILKFVHLFQEIQNWQYKLYQVDIDSTQSISKFLDIILDQLVDHNLENKINNHGLINIKLRKIIHQIKDLGLMELDHDDSEVSKNDNEMQISMIITLSATNLVIIICFMVYSCCHQQYQK